MREEKTYGGLDRFRLLAAFLVAAIHTSPLGSFSSEADFFLTRVLARVAVPFFFIVTGQFVVGPWLFAPKDGTHTFGAGQTLPAEIGKSQNAGDIWKYLQRLLILYGISVLIYLPVGIYAGQYRNLSVALVLRMLLFDGTFYHLWYFPACILGILLICFLHRFLGRKGMLGAAAVLYTVGLLGDSYYGLAQKLPGLGVFYEKCFHIFSYTRNGIFFAPLFLLLGAMAGQRAKSEDAGEGLEEIKERAGARRQFLVLRFLFSVSLLTVEAFTLRHFQMQRHDSMYIMLPFVMVFLYRILLMQNLPGRKKLRRISTWIYVIHPAMILLVRACGKVTGMQEFFVENSLTHYLMVCITSFIAAVAYEKLSAKYAASHPGLKPCSQNPQTGRMGEGNLAPARGENRGERPEVFSSGRAWIELDRRALQKNVDMLRFSLPAGCELMPVIKADAYGHGAVLMGRELNRLGVHAFCVATVSEGAELRKNGIKGEILVLGYTHPEQFGMLRRYNLMQTVIDFPYGEQLNRYGKPLKVHIGIDTGMHRLGERSENTEQLKKLFRMENLRVESIFTHLCASDTDTPEDRAFTMRQINAFHRTVQKLKKEGCSCPKVHLQSSYGVLNYPEAAGDYARVGIALYGVLSTKADETSCPLPLSPVLSLKARVAAVKELYWGETAGYGRQFVAQHDMKIAVLSIGYADGLPRCLSDGGGAVLLRGQRAPIIGRICMDQTIVDVSEIPGVRQGDIAVLIGSSKEQTITASDLAKQAGTITNEILSRLGERLERVLVL